MSNLQLINAPAGSGKSTEIKRLVREWSAERPFDRLLCVTFTNRAADELKADISSAYIEVSTIHSFLNGFSRSLFSAPEIIDYYFEIYGEAIVERLENADKNDAIEESNSRYREQLGAPLTFDLIKRSVDALYYNERPFNTLYRGGLSHDGLLSFVASCAKRFPNLYRRVSAKYRRVIIDEYQDTDVNVLEFFLEATHGSNADLHLYGDRMQQIYKTDPERFQTLIRSFEVPKRDVVNYRSSQAIVRVLNAIYNDKNLRQVADSKIGGSIPRVHFSDTPAETADQVTNEESLTLSVHNSSIFGAIDSLELYKALTKMPDHGQNSRYSAAAVLTEPDWERVPNPLLRLLYGLLNIEAEYFQGHIGTVISTLRAHPSDFGVYSLNIHKDKALLAGELENLFRVMGNDSSTIKNVIETLSILSLSKVADVHEYVEGEEYERLVSIPFRQVRNAFDFRLAPQRSTQHGVKGESHEKVVFIAETSQSPVVRMKTLFDLWPKNELNLDILEEIYGKLYGLFRSVKIQIAADISKLNKETFPEFEEVITAKAQSIVQEFGESDLFTELYGTTYNSYLKRPGVTHAKKLFSLSPIEGLLAAYRLFYVGCSRAKSELDVVIPLSEVSEWKVAAEKFKDLGFEIVSTPVS